MKLFMSLNQMLEIVLMNMLLLAVVIAEMVFPCAVSADCNDFKKLVQYENLKKGFDENPGKVLSDILDIWSGTNKRCERVGKYLRCNKISDDDKDCNRETDGYADDLGGNLARIVKENRSNKDIRELLAQMEKLFLKWEKKKEYVGIVRTYNGFAKRLRERPAYPVTLKAIDLPQSGFISYPIEAKKAIDRFQSMIEQYKKIMVILPTIQALDHKIDNSINAMKDRITKVEDAFNSFSFWWGIVVIAMIMTIVVAIVLNKVRKQKNSGTLDPAVIKNLEAPIIEKMESIINKKTDDIEKRLSDRTILENQLTETEQSISQRISDVQQELMEEIQKIVNRFQQDIHQLKTQVGTNSIKCQNCEAYEGLPGSFPCPLCGWIPAGTASPKPKKEATDVIELNPGQWELGEISFKDQPEIDLKIKNCGDRIIALNAIKNNSSWRINVDESKSLPLTIEPNQEVSIRLILKQWTPEGDNVSCDVSFVFDNCTEKIWPISGQSRRVHLVAEPDRLEIGPIHYGHPKEARFSLINYGTRSIELTLNTDESVQSWLSILTKPQFSLGPWTDNTQRSRDIRFVVKSSEINSEKITNNPIDAIIRVHGNKSPENASLDIPLAIKVKKTKPSSDYIGIDFGTTSSVVCIRIGEAFEFVTPEKEEEKSALIPSILRFDGSYDYYHYGWDAQTHADDVLTPEQGAWAIKKMMMSNKSLNRKFYDKEFTHSKLAACVITKLIEMAEKFYARKQNNSSDNYIKIDKSIITVPVKSQNKKELMRRMKDACKSAGIETKNDIIINEPSAAAIAYIYDYLESDTDSPLADKFKNEGKFYLLVYDHGGTTLDVCLLKVYKGDDKKTHLKPLAKKGNDKVGGDAIDLLIMKKMVEQVKRENDAMDSDLILSSVFCKPDDLDSRRRRENWTDQRWRQTLKARHKWKKACEKIKRELSKKVQSEFVLESEMVFDGNGKEIGVTSAGQCYPITRMELNNWIRDARILDKLANTVKETIEEADGKNEDFNKQVDAVLHTGRTGLMPIIEETLNDLFKNKLEMGSDLTQIIEEDFLKVCVAKGAAIYGNNIKGQPNSKIILDEDDDLRSSGDTQWWY